MNTAVKGCQYTTVVDCASFFYRWRTHLADRHGSTVVTRRGQEIFPAAVMDCENSARIVV